MHAKAYAPSNTEVPYKGDTVPQQEKNPSEQLSSRIGFQSVSNGAIANEQSCRELSGKNFSRESAAEKNSQSAQDTLMKVERSQMLLSVTFVLIIRWHAQVSALLQRFAGAKNDRSTPVQVLRKVLDLVVADSQASFAW
jgi:hypothetical protein